MIIYRLSPNFFLLPVVSVCLCFDWLPAGRVTFIVEPRCVDTSVSDNLRTQQRFDISVLMRDDMKGATFLISPSQAEKGTNVTASSIAGA